MLTDKFESVSFVNEVSVNNILDKTATCLTERIRRGDTF